MSRIHRSVAEAALKVITTRRQTWLDESPSLATLVKTVPELIGDLDERDEQFDDISYRVTAAFTDTDERGVSLDAMTVLQLRDLVMAAIRRDPDAQNGDDRG